MTPPDFRDLSTVAHVAYWGVILFLGGSLAVGLAGLVYLIGWAS